MFMLEAHDYLEVYTWILIHYWRCVVEASRGGGFTGCGGLNDRWKVLNLISKRYRRAQPAATVPHACTAGKRPCQLRILPRSSVPVQTLSPQAMRTVTLFPSILLYTGYHMSHTKQITNAVMVANRQGFRSLQKSPHQPPLLPSSS